MARSIKNYLVGHTMTRTERYRWWGRARVFCVSWDDYDKAPEHQRACTRFFKAYNKRDAIVMFLFWHSDVEHRWTRTASRELEPSSLGVEDA